MTKARTIADLGTGFVNISDTGTEGTKVATGTTAQRGSTTGQWRFNTTTGYFEGRNATGFASLEPSATISSVDVTEIDSQAGGNATIVVTGTNFSSGGTIAFVGTSAEFNASTTTYNSETQVTAVAPKASFLNAQEPYKVRFTSATGVSGSSAVGLINVDTSPSWTTNAGSLGSIAEDATGNHFTLAATDPDGDTVSYSETGGTNITGAGLSLNSSTGVISGDPTNVSSDTTVNFTGRATANGKNVDRSFSFVVEDNPLLGISEVYNSETQSGNITTHLQQYGNLTNHTASSSNTNSTWTGTKIVTLADGNKGGSWSNITTNMPTSGGLTICLWAKLISTNNSNPRLFDIYNTAGDFYNQYTGNVTYEMNYRNSGGNINIRTLTGNSSWSNTNWHFLCWRFSVGLSESSQVIKFTVDDYSNNTLHTHTPSSASSGSNSMKAGFMCYDPDGSANTYEFEGSTGGWRVFSANLTDAQLSYVYNSGKGRF